MQFVLSQCFCDAMMMLIRHDTMIQKLCECASEQLESIR